MNNLQKFDRKSERIEIYREVVRSAIALLLNIVSNSQNYLVIKSAVNALAEIAREEREAIAQLETLIDFTTDERILVEAAYSLARIDFGNTKAKSILTKLLKSNTESIRLEAAEYLINIERDNSDAIDTFIEILNDENTKRRDIAAYALGRITRGNERAIAALITTTDKYLDTEDDSLCYAAFSSLLEIAEDNTEVIPTLFKVLNSKNPLHYSNSISNYFFVFAKGNSDAITGLISIIKSTQNQAFKKKAISLLGQIGEGDPKVTSILLNIIETSSKKFLVKEAISALGDNAKNEPIVINVLGKLIQTTKNKSLIEKALSCLLSISFDNPNAITKLVEIIKYTEDEFTRQQAILRFNYNTQGKLEVIKALIEILARSKNNSTIQAAYYYLGTIDRENIEALEAIDFLVKIIIKSKTDTSIYYFAVDSLAKIAPNHPQLILVLNNPIQITNNENIILSIADSLNHRSKLNNKIRELYIQIIKNTQDKYIFERAASSLEIIAKNDRIAIETRSQNIDTSDNPCIILQAASSLETINSGNSKAIATLIKYLDAEDETIFRQALVFLEAVELNSEKTVTLRSEAIANLEKLIKSSNQEDRCCQFAYLLGKIDPDRQLAISTLIKLSYSAKNYLIEANNNLYLVEIAKLHPPTAFHLLQVIRISIALVEYYNLDNQDLIHHYYDYLHNICNAARYLNALSKDLI